MLCEEKVRAQEGPKKELKRRKKSGLLTSITGVGKKDSRKEAMKGNSEQSSL